MLGLFIFRFVSPAMEIKDKLKQDRNVFSYKGRAEKLDG